MWMKCTFFPFSIFEVKMGPPDLKSELWCKWVHTESVDSCSVATESKWYQTTKSDIPLPLQERIAQSKSRNVHFQKFLLHAASQNKPILVHKLDPGAPDASLPRVASQCVPLQGAGRNSCLVVHSQSLQQQLHHLCMKRGSKWVMIWAGRRRCLWKINFWNVEWQHCGC